MNIKRYLFLVLLLLFVACEQTLIENISEERSQKIFLLLNQHNIASERIKTEENLWQVKVDKNDFPLALEVLRSNYLLESRKSELNSSSSLLSGQEERSAKLDRVISDQLESTILKIPGILDVRIHLSPQQKFSEIGQTPNKFCSVMLFVDRDYKLSTRKIKSLVTGATGILKKNIKIVTSIRDVHLKEIEVTHNVLQEKDSTRTEQTNFNYLLMLGAGLSLFGLLLLCSSIIKLRRNSVNEII